MDGYTVNKLLIGGIANPSEHFNVYKMEEESKYYTPIIEEFHVGFEVETTGSFPELPIQWHKTVIHKNTLHFAADWNLKYGPQFRVKYLDKADIESLGFEEEWVPDCYDDNDEIKLGWALYLDNITAILLHKNKLNYVQIVKQRVYNINSGNWEAEHLFKGVIKNKSELKQLLKQLGIGEESKEKED